MTRACSCTEYFRDPACEWRNAFDRQAAPHNENQRRLWGVCPVCRAGHGDECSMLPGIYSSADAMFSGGARHWHPERVAAAPPIPRREEP
jgi:hypothetical protein